MQRKISHRNHPTQGKQEMEFSAFSAEIHSSPNPVKNDYFAISCIAVRAARLPLYVLMPIPVPEAE